MITAQVEMEIHDKQYLDQIQGLNALDQIEVFISEAAKTHPMQDVLTHRFTPGLYIREIFMPAGSMLTSKIHKTEHPYVISSGVVSVWSENDGFQKITGPYTGITKPGTRRLLYIHEDTTWTTFHPTNKTDVAMIEADIIESHINPLLIPAGTVKELMK